MDTLQSDMAKPDEQPASRLRLLEFRELEEWTIKRNEGQWSSFMYSALKLMTLAMLGFKFSVSCPKLEGMPSVVIRWVFSRWRERPLFTWVLIYLKVRNMFYQWVRLPGRQPFPQQVFSWIVPDPVPIAPSHSNWLALSEKCSDPAPEVFSVTVVKCFVCNITVVEICGCFCPFEMIFVRLE